LAFAFFFLAAAFFFAMNAIGVRGRVYGKIPIVPTFDAQCV
jgi:hypothetical protein